VSSRTDQTLYALNSKSIHIISNGQITKKADLNFEARSLEVNERDGEIYIGSYVKLIFNY